MANIKFGTDGWRGVIAWDVTYDNVRRMAQALATFVNENMPSNLDAKTSAVVVGFDRRFMSDKFAEDIANVLEENDLDVTLLDKPVSTPMLSYLTLTKFWLGIMVTASHNGPEYNGIKIKVNGGSIPSKFTKEIEELIDKKQLKFVPNKKIATKKDLEKLYFKYIGSKVNLKKISSLKGKIAVDYMHGSSTGYFENLLSANKIIPLHTNIDPMFGGIKPEPKESTLQELKSVVVKNKALLGVGFDGDGDRAGFFDEKGKYLTPMVISAVVLHNLASVKKLKGKVVQTVSMGYLTKRIAEKFNLEYEEVPVGFKNVVERTFLEEVLFGAEESGGYCWKGVIPERDGLLLTLTLLEIMANRKMKLSELIKEIETLYGTSAYIRFDMTSSKIIDKNALADKLKKKFPKKILGKTIKEMMCLDGLKVVLSDDSWLLMRPSGTEPVVRMYAETSKLADTEQFLELGKKVFATFK